MNVSAVMATAVSALGANAARVAAAADNVANLDTAGFRATEVQTVSLVTARDAGGAFAPAGVRALARPSAAVPAAPEASNVDLARELTNLILARVAYRAGLAVLDSANEMLRALVDIRA